MKSWLKFTILLYPLLLYFIAFNPYLEPSTYDSVYYLQASKAIIKEGVYADLRGYILDWPPLFSFLLAPATYFDINPVIWGKVVILISVITGAVYSYRVLAREGYDFPLLSCFFFLLCPTSFLWGTRIMTEWPYTALSFLFLYYASNITKNGRWRDTILSGLALGGAMLTRYVGIALYGSFGLHTLFEAEKRNSKHFTVLMIATLLFGIWVFRNLYLYYFEGVVTTYNTPERLFLVSFSDLSATLPNFFLQLHKFEIPDILPIMINIAITALIILGFFLQEKRRSLKISDTYVIMSFMMMIGTPGMFVRYLIPIAPFIFSYLFSSITFLWDRLSLSRHLLRLGVILYALYFSFYNFYLIAWGNNVDYHGLSVIASPTPEKFYDGKWLDLYEIHKSIKDNDSKEPIVLLQVGATAYVQYFFNRQTIMYPEINQSHFLLLDNSLVKEVPASIGNRWKLLIKREFYTLYERKDKE